jgi:excisionase family DNA binding protein
MERFVQESKGKENRECQNEPTQRMRPTVEARTSIRQSSFRGTPEMLTAKELEAMLKIDVKTIYSYVQRGLIPYVRIQSNVRFPKQEIFDWIEQQSSRPRPVNGSRTERR